MEHNMKLFRKPFEMIKNGEKSIELRLYDKKRKLVNPGDTIVFSCIDDENDKVKTEVIKIHVFKSFEEMYGNLPLEKCGYQEGEKADSNDMLEYYSKENELKYGTVGIEIRLVD